MFINCGFAALFALSSPSQIYLITIYVSQQVSWFGVAVKAFVT